MFWQIIECCKTMGKEGINISEQYTLSTPLCGDDQIILNDSEEQPQEALRYIFIINVRKFIYKKRN
jgi:hypothetical protein